MLLDGKKLNYLVMEKITTFLAEINEIADLLIFFLYCQRQRFPQEPLPWLAGRSSKPYYRGANT